jgi:hypothetical protein
MNKGERIIAMLWFGNGFRLWHDQRFLDHDSISGDWVVMDSKGNNGLGDCLYSGASLDKALDALEAKP